MLKSKIQKLIDLIENTNIEEIEVSSFWGAQKVRLSKTKNIAQETISVNENNVSNKNLDSNHNTILHSPEVINDSNKDINIESDNSADLINNDYSDESKFKIITAPLVGTFYLSPKPDDPTFVNLGDSIDCGHTLCIIEAMKIFNEIESEFSGELIEIYVEDGSPVEYGQELFVLKI